MKKKLKQIGKVALAAALGGGAGTTTASATGADDPETLLVVAISNALTAILAYLKTSPKEAKPKA